MHRLQVRLIISILLYVASLITVAVDQVTFGTKWIAFALYIAAVLNLVLINFRPALPKSQHIKAFFLKNRLEIIIVCVILLTRFIFLNVYPYN